MYSCLHLSDIHGFHEDLRFYKHKYDYVFITGDITNSKDTTINREELDSFLVWLYNHKENVRNDIIIVPGNHDVSIERLNLKNYIESYGFKCLIHEEYKLENGKKVFGSPYTPTFGKNWAYNRDRSKLSNYWNDIPEDTEILLTHGPPKGILDISYRKEDNHIERCGDKSLMNKIDNLPRLRYHMFGHIHDCKDIMNYGIFTRNNIWFMNGALVKDGRFDLGLIHEGHKFWI